MPRSAGGLEVVAATSSAGVHTAILVENASANVKILFDLGTHESRFDSCLDCFLSHGHTDHAGACIQHARSARMRKGIPTYYVPADVSAALEQARVAFSTMDGENIPMNIVAMNPGDSVVVGNQQSQFRVMAFSTMHRVQSQGYAVYSIKTTKGKLLEEYRSLSGREIGELKKSGVEVTSPAEHSEHLDLVYSGDTIFEGLLNCPQISAKDLFKADILIMECTYLDGPYDRAMQWEHVHIDDIVNNISIFQETGLLVLTHISVRYAPWQRCIKLLKNALPAEIREKTMVTLKEFGSKHVLTTLRDAEQQVERRKGTPGFGWGQGRSVSITTTSTTTEIKPPPPLPLAQSTGKVRKNPHKQDSHPSKKHYRQRHGNEKER